MMINTGLNVTGLGFATAQSGLERMDNAARKIAVGAIQSVNAIGEQPGGTPPPGPTVPREGGDLVEPIVEQQQGLYQAQAGMLLIRNTDQRLGALISAMV